MLFKAHKAEEGKEVILYPANTIDMAPVTRNSKFIFVSGGGEGKLTIWDYEQKAKCSEWIMPAPVTAAKFNESLSLLVFATGEDWCQGVQRGFKYASSIYARVLEPIDLQPQ